MTLSELKLLAAKVSDNGCKPDDIAMLNAETEKVNAAILDAAYDAIIDGKHITRDAVLTHDIGGFVAVKPEIDKATGDIINVTIEDATKRKQLSLTSLYKRCKDKNVDFGAKVTWRRDVMALRMPLIAAAIKALHGDLTPVYNAYKVTPDTLGVEEKAIDENFSIGALQKILQSAVDALQVDGIKKVNRSDVRWLIMTFAKTNAVNALIMPRDERIYSLVLTVAHHLLTGKDYAVVYGKA